MLLNLSILNFIIFEKIFLDFTDGFNVFTGETGAGKSMIIDSLNLLLGGKSNKGFVRKDCDKATIQGSFYIEENSPLMALFAEQGIRTEDGTIIITREIMDNGRSTARINNVLINISFLKTIARYLLDIHGQYEQQSILDSGEHILILDKMCGIELKALLESYQSLYKDYLGLKNEIAALEKSNQDKNDRMDFLEFQINEISSAGLKPGEEESLFGEYNIMSNLNDITMNVFQAADYFTNENRSVTDMLTEALKAIKKVSHYDDTIKGFESALELIIDSSQELSFALIDYANSKDLDNERLFFLEQRLEDINHIKRKYNMEISDLLQYRDKAVRDLELLKNIESRISTLHMSLKSITAEMESLSDNLRSIRQIKAAIMEEEIEKQLHSLNMKDARFRINITDMSSFNELGKDNILFLISTNPGMDLMPLDKILSGGEVSRIMLAIKSIINEIDDIPTMIFDEIDTGISGKTAYMVGEKIKRISTNHQVICVTHSPQIASAAHTHFVIEKLTDGQRTYSSVTRLGYQDRIREVARLLSSLDITEISMKNAEEMVRANEK
ncbi:MAG: DNA repair protein RecN [Clostridiales bacterium 38_11]|nr:MAG: DNA repair protein RecN [Clostridiales bacterium 38_11]HBH11840.1 DNA repair protein RecN [Clostridiales bacterium]